MSKETWLIEPHGSLIFRDGRPFNFGDGAYAKSLDFPYPSTITGAVRTRAGLATVDGDLGKFTTELGDDVLQISVRGPLLVDINGNLLVHAPADCGVFEANDKSGKLVPLKPLEESDGVLSNLNDLKLVGLEKNQKAKPHKMAPKFWYWSEFEKWLKEPKMEAVGLSTLGIGSLPKDKRTHVAIDYSTKAGKDGEIFGTSGLEFAQKEQRFGLAVQVDYGGFTGRISEGIAPLGAERRLASWRESKQFALCPDEIKNKIVAENYCRLVLLTPAIFDDGFLPKWLETANGVNVEITAAALNRYEVISGYDFKSKGPKPTRRMCPAGTVFFLRLNDVDIEKLNDLAIGNWVDKTWFNCISDNEQDRKDGFGLAALGTWDGSYLKIEEALGE